MKFSELQPLIWYRVTTGTEDKTLHLGDQVQLCSNGDLLVNQAHGWIPADELPKINDLMAAEFIIDQELGRTLCKKLEEELAEVKIKYNLNE